LRLRYDVDGPSEIGGLVINPKYRKSPEKFGKQISFMRFLFVAEHPELFKDTIHSELLPPFDRDGNSPLWEALGRKFLKLNYHEADLLSRKDKNFILDLFPSTPIHQCLLPQEIQDSIGEVGPSTKPVKRMLENVGFKYNNEVDPFDGGPHYQAKVNDIQPIKDKITGPIEFIDFSTANSDQMKDYLVSFKKEGLDYSAMKVPVIYKDNKILLPNTLKNNFGFIEGQNSTGIPF
jgi:arginine N-succinyltransferase